MSTEITLVSPGKCHELHESSIDWSDLIKETKQQMVETEDEARFEKLRISLKWFKKMQRDGEPFLGS